MAKNIVDTIDLAPKYLEELRAILAKTLSHKLVWAYGSRVKWTASEASDVDCVVFNASYQEVDNAKEALDESDIPFIVQLLNWESIPDDFKDNIKQQYFILQD